MLDQNSELTYFPQLTELQLTNSKIIKPQKHVISCDAKKPCGRGTSHIFGFTAITSHRLPKQFEPNLDSITVAPSFPCAVPVTRVSTHDIH